MLFSLRDIASSLPLLQSVQWGGTAKETGQVSFRQSWGRCEGE